MQQIGGEKRLYKKCKNTTVSRYRGEILGAHISNRAIVLQGQITSPRAEVREVRTGT